MTGKLTVVICSTDHKQCSIISIDACIESFNHSSFPDIGPGSSLASY